MLLRALWDEPGATGGSRASELLERLGLADAAGRKFAGYSKGMKRKLTIAAGIIHRPAILFLDEPTTGIDVASARCAIRQLIADLNAGGTTIFLTTHYIEEAERLCRRIASSPTHQHRHHRIAGMRQTEGRYVVQLGRLATRRPCATPSRSEFGSLHRRRCRRPTFASSRPSDPRRRLLRAIEDRGRWEVFEARRVPPVARGGLRAGHRHRGQGDEAGEGKGQDGSRRMKSWIASWNILAKDMRTYTPPPNISWGLLFPLAWTGMFFIRSGSGLDSIPALLPGLIGVSVLFGTTSFWRSP